METTKKPETRNAVRVFAWMGHAPGIIMIANEKDKLLAFFDSDGRWCQNAEARDAHGSPVKFHDPLAAAWDITGALCYLFGWNRAYALFGSFERHIHKRKRRHAFNRDSAIESMLALQSFNDRSDTSFEVIHYLLQTMPVWTGISRSSNASAALSSAATGEDSSTSKALRTTV